MAHRTSLCMLTTPLEDSPCIAYSTASDCSNRSRRLLISTIQPAFFDTDCNSLSLSRLSAPQSPRIPETLPTNAPLLAARSLQHATTSHKKHISKAVEHVLVAVRYCPDRAQKSHASLLLFLSCRRGIWCRSSRLSPGACRLVDKRHVSMH